MKSDERKEYIDLMKGIAMILVIATHILPFSEPVNSVLANLHNSTFYFASGILFFSTLKQVEKGKKSVVDVLKKKFYRIIYPFMIWTFLYTIIEICIQYVLKDITSVLLHAILKAANRLWFLPVLFTAFLINLIVWHFNVNGKLLIVVWISVIFASALYSSAISKILFFSFLVWAGTCYANAYPTGGILILSPVLYMIVCYFAFFRGGGYSITTEDSTQAGYRLFLLYVIATIGALTMWCIAWKICKNIDGRWSYFLIYMGKESLYFYIMHFIAIYCFEYMAVQSSTTKICCFFVAVLIPWLYVKFVKNTWINNYLFCIK